VSAAGAFHNRASSAHSHCRPLAGWSKKNIPQSVKLKLAIARCIASSLAKASFVASSALEAQRQILSSGGVLRSSLGSLSDVESLSSLDLRAEQAPRTGSASESQFIGVDKGRCNRLFFGTSVKNDVQRRLNRYVASTQRAKYNLATPQYLTNVHDR
jgi:hypothetical protein